MNILASNDPAHVVMPRVASLLDQWWLGLHQWAIQALHLGYCLDEFTFRSTRCKAKARGLLFYRLMEQAIGCTPVFRQETFEKRDIFLSGKKGESFNRRNTLSILRIKFEA